MQTAIGKKALNGKILKNTSNSSIFSCQNFALYGNYFYDVFVITQPLRPYQCPIC